MNYIDKQLQSKTENISFIQIKEDSNIKNIDIDLTDFPLPILIDSLIKEVKETDGEEISLGKVVDGIVYLLGIGDDDFPYIDKYKDIIVELVPDIKDKILFDSIESFKEEDTENSLIYSRALLNLDPNSIKGLFQYGLALESTSIKFTEDSDRKKAEEILGLSTFNFEKILDIDDEYDLAYYKLGFHYKHLSQYIKADLIWRKFLKFTEDDSLKEEVRGELSIIEDEVNFETAITYLAHGDFEKSLKALLKLMPTHEESWNVNYLLGKAYRGLGETEKAIEYINKAIECNGMEADLYNELGALYYSDGEVKKAKDTFTDGLEHFDSDYKLLFNRSLMYSSLGEYDNALEDAKEAYEINDDDNIKAQIDWLKENF